MRLITLFAALLVLPAFAQGQGGKTIWKKTVSREIEIYDSTYMPDKSRKKQTLYDELVKEVRAGRLAAYANMPPYFEQRLSVDDHNIAPYNDTVIVMDEHDVEHQLVRKNEIDSRYIHTYRTLEEWTYEPETGTTNIQITGIAAVRDVYGEDGTFRAKQGMFWLKYKDAIGTILKYEKAHPEQSLTKVIWRDNFDKHNAPARFDALALRKMGRLYDEDTIRHHWRNENDDSCWQAEASIAQMKRRMDVYDGNDVDLISPHKFAGISFDTLTVLDEEGKEQEVIRSVCCAFCDGHWDYGILEHWSFVPLSGITHMQPTAMAYLKRINNVDSTLRSTRIEELLRYSDVMQLVQRYAPYNPTDYLPARIWDNYFVSDVRPEVVK